MTARTAEERLAAWDAVSRWPIVVAAVAPLILALFPVSAESPIAIGLDLVSWAVFFVDLVVRVWIDHRYLRTGAGLFDLTIVVFTFPWYILPGVEGTQFLAVFRLARLLRLFTATGVGGKLRYLYNAMGALLITTVFGLFIAALVVLADEPPSSGFDTFGDAMWWGVVTLTTVGYGDLVPVTPKGRLAGFIVMVLGLAVLGTLAGVLASIFGGAADVPDPEATTPESLAGQLDRVERRLDRLERLLGEVNDRLSRSAPS
jgi:voltage-gated potassium channel